MKRLITKNWFVAVVGTVAYLGTTLWCFSTVSVKAVPISHAEEPAQQPAFVESWSFSNPDLDRMVQELKQEKEALSLREQQIKELESRLASERQEINVVIDGIGQMQREFEQNVQRIKQEEIPNLKKLAKVHSAMSPEGSANILRELADDEIVKVLFYLRPAESGPLLEAFGRLGKTEAQRAAQITERLRRAVESPAEKAKP